MADCSFVNVQEKSCPCSSSTLGGLPGITGKDGIEAGVERLLGSSFRIAAWQRSTTTTSHLTSLSLPTEADFVHNGGFCITASALKGNLAIAKTGVVCVVIVTFGAAFVLTITAVFTAGGGDDDGVAKGEMFCPFESLLLFPLGCSLSGDKALLSNGDPGSALFGLAKPPLIVTVVVVVAVEVVVDVDEPAVTFTVVEITLGL